MSNLVMIIDDSQVTRTILKVCLSRENIPCLLFADGVEALTAFQQQPDLVPAVVILDISLPGVDGYKVAQVLRSKPRLDQTAIVMLSGRSGVLDRLRARLAGAEVYLVKPFTQQTIVSVISRYLSPATEPTMDKRIGGSYGT
jgi:CheY-like chemotaxis protein